MQTTSFLMRWPYQYWTKILQASRTSSSWEMIRSGQLAPQRSLKLSLESSCSSPTVQHRPKTTQKAVEEMQRFYSACTYFPRSPLYGVQGCSMSASRGGIHTPEAGHG
jgi:hypothetical protein